MTTSAEYFSTIDKPSSAEFKDRGSKFIAFAYPVDSTDAFKIHLQQLKKEHPKAVHHCFAYRLGMDNTNYRVSDDGEPAGTAGRPILGQIDSKGLTNVAVIVVRYFGGTLLGVPGLINAYKNATAMALQLVPIIQKPVLVYYQLQFDYTRQNDVMMILKQCMCLVTKQEQQLFCILETGVPAARIQEVEYRLKQLHTVEFRKL